MKTAEQLAQEVMKEIGEVLDDTSIPKRTYLEALQAVRDDIDMRIDAVECELQEEEDG